MSVVIARGLTIGYGHAALVPPLSFQIERGQVWALVGRNGAGKSTLLKTLLGETRPLGGALAWGEGIKRAWVPQRSHLDLEIPRRVVDMVSEGRDRGWGFLRSLASPSHRRALAQVLALTDTSALAQRPFGILSEGQKQRVLIARALVSAPDIMLLDEPTSAMDPMNEGVIFDLLETVRRERGLTVLVASHHPEVIPGLASHAIFLDREDQVALAGPVSEILGSGHFSKRYGHLRGTPGPKELSGGEA